VTFSSGKIAICRDNKSPSAERLARRSKPLGACLSRRFAIPFRPSVVYKPLALTMLLALAGRAMSEFWNLNLIRFLDFYFTLLFVVGTVRRFEQYQNVGKLALTCPGRWPKLLRLVREHRTVFMTWATVAPGVLALALSAAQLVASRVLWPEAGQTNNGLTVGSLAAHWVALLFVCPLGLAMIAVDLYGLMRVGTIPRAEMEKYFDQAEYWLGSKTAHVVHVFTLGYINPRKMVSLEVRKALEGASSLLNSTLWWVNMQMALRFSFGLSLWMVWALRN
jgi:hypothetical protein